MKRFRLLGRKWFINDNIQSYNEMRGVLESIALDKLNQFKEKCKIKIKNADDIFENVRDFFEICASEYAGECVSFFLNEGIFSVDKDSFLSLCLERHIKAYDIYGKLADGYKNLFEDEASRKSIEEYNRKNRSRWQGGGYGIGGAVKGAMKAGALNIGTGIFRSIGDGISDSAARSRFENKRREFFKKSNYLDQFSQALKVLFIEMRVMLINLLERNGCNKYSTDFDSKKAEALFGNLNRGLIPSEKKIDVIFEILESNPYFEKIYHYMLNNYKDSVKEIFTVANFFRIDMATQISDFVSGLSADVLKKCTNYIEAKNERDIFIKTCSDLGFDWDKHGVKSAILKIDEAVNRLAHIEFDKVICRYSQNSYLELRSAIEALSQHAEKIGAKESTIFETKLSALKKRLFELESLEIGLYYNNLSSGLTDSVESIDSGKKKLTEFYDSKNFSADNKLNSIFLELDAKRNALQMPKLISFSASLPKNTEAEAIAAKNKIEQEGRVLGLPPDNAVFKEISLLVSKFDNDARTSDGILYNNREEKSLAQSASNDFKKLLASIDFSSAESVQQAKNEVERYNSLVKDSYLNFLCAKELCAATLVEMGDYLLPTKFWTYSNAIKKYSTAINNKWLEDMLSNDTARISERKNYLESDTYKEKYKLAYAYSQQKKSPLIVRMLQSAIALAIIFFLFKFLIGFATKEYNTVISAGIVLLGMVGMIKGSYDASTQGKVIYGELVKNPDQVLEEYK